MAVSFFLVGFGKSLPIQLLGVACSSVQSGLGEASMLAYTSKFHTRSTLTAWYALINCALFLSAPFNMSIFLFFLT